MWTILDAFERRHLELGAERRHRGGHVDHGDQVVAVPDEALVLRDDDVDEEVARRATGLAGVTSPADADPLALGDPRRDVDADGVRQLLAAAAGAARAALLGDLAVATADVAGDRPRDLAERRAADRLQDAVAVAARAGLDRRAGLGAVAVAALAAVDDLVADVDRRPRRRLLERDLDGDLHVAARARAARDRRRSRRRRTSRRGRRSSRSRRSSAPGHRAAGRRGRSGRRPGGARGRTGSRTPRRPP